MPIPSHHMGIVNSSAGTSVDVSSLSVNVLSCISVEPLICDYCQRQKNVMQDASVFSFDHCVENTSSTYREIRTSASCIMIMY